MRTKHRLRAANIGIFILLAVLVILAFAVYNGFTVSWKIMLCSVITSWLVSMFLLIPLSDAELREYSDKHRGCVNFIVPCNCELNGYVLPAGQFIIYKNGISYMDSDGCSYFDFGNDSDVKMDLKETGLDVDITSRGHYDHFILTGKSLDLYLAYKYLVNFGANFEDSFASFVKEHC